MNAETIGVIIVFSTFVLGVTFQLGRYSIRIERLEKTFERLEHTQQVHHEENRLELQEIQRELAVRNEHD